MKIIVLIICVLPFLAFGQSDKLPVSNPNRLGEKIIQLNVKRIAPGEIKLPFSTIQIIDNRFDTSKLGFVPVEQFIPNKKTMGRKLAFDEGVAKALENYYNEFYQNAFSNTDLKLLIVLKKLWLSGIDNERNKEIDISKNEKSHSFLYCKWEYYLNRGNVYLPIKRIDTVVNGVSFESEVQSNNSKTTVQVFKLLLSGLIEVIDFNSAVAAIEKFPKKTLAEIQKYNAGYFDIPVLKDTGIKKGVYLTFNEFKNNTPSIINFTEKKIKLRLLKYENYLEDEQGNRILKYWGYYTGEELKIGKYGNERLYRKNNTFEFFLKHNYVRDNSMNESEVWIPYQIDMETGEIY